MATEMREKVRARPDVASEDVDDIIEIAARRQEEASGRATRAEVEAVARELDIAPEHVEAAVQELRARREEVARAAAGRRRSWVVAGVVAVVVALGGVGVVGLGAASVRDAASEAVAAEARVDAVLERQASLAPQLASLAGADGGSLTMLAAKVRSAPTLDARLAAADELSVAMATRLGALPAPTSDAEGALRLQLHDEITGSQNRVSVELGRYREARAVWQDAASHGAGWLAVATGVAEGP